MIKPVENQKCIDTKNELKENIDLKNLGVGIEGVQNISKGGLIVNVTNAEAKRKLKNKVQEEMGDKYTVEEPKFKNPQVILLGAEKDIVNKELEEIKEHIIQQNELTKLSTNINEQITVKRKYINNKRNNSGNIILEVNSDIYNDIMDMETLFLGWRECRVSKYVNIIRCFKCLQFNHIMENCRNEEVCAKCAGQHKASNCENDTEKCINCVKAMERFRIKLNYNHSVFSKQCPCFLKLVEKQNNITKLI